MSGEYSYEEWENLRGQLEGSGFMAMPRVDDPSHAASVNHGSAQEVYPDTTELGNRRCDNSHYANSHYAISNLGPVNKGDLIIVRTDGIMHDDCCIMGLADHIAEISEHSQFLIVQSDVFDITKLDEAEMGKYGWVRRKS